MKKPSSGMAGWRVFLHLKKCKIKTFIEYSCIGGLIDLKCDTLRKMCRTNLAIFKGIKVSEGEDEVCFCHCLMVECQTENTGAGPGVAELRLQHLLQPAAHQPAAASTDTSLPILQTSII